MDTEKQRQRRHDDARLTESGNARSKQLNTHGAYRVANQQSLACLSGSERRRPGWFLDMKYQTCFFKEVAVAVCLVCFMVADFPVKVYIGELQGLFLELQIRLLTNKTV